MTDWNTTQPSPPPLDGPTECGVCYLLIQVADLCRVFWEIKDLEYYIATWLISSHERDVVFSIHAKKEQSGVFRPAHYMIYILITRTEFTINEIIWCTFVTKLISGHNRYSYSQQPEMDLILPIELRNRAIRNSFTVRGKTDVQMICLILGAEHVICKTNW